MPLPKVRWNYTVVATDLLEIRRFNDDHGQIVSVASTADAFADALAKALLEKDATVVSRRVDVARSNSWQSRIEQMTRLIAAAVESKSRDAGRWDLRLRRAYRAARRRSVAVAMAVAGCAPPSTDYLLAAANPANRGSTVRYTNVTGGVRDYRPVSPRDWRELNRNVSPTPAEPNANDARRGR